MKTFAAFASVELDSLLPITIDLKSILLLQAAIVVLLPFILWWQFGLKRFFPLAVIQIFSGILLGPTIFGAVAPEAFDALFSKDLLGGIKAIAIIAVCLFAFLAGTEADRDLIRRSGRAVVSIGIGGLMFTWGFGIIIGLGVGLAFASALGPLNGLILFAVAFGLCNAVPALPILAVLLNELGLNRSRLGAIALASAGIGDALFWASLAIVLPFAAGGDGVIQAAAIAFGGGLVALGLCLYVASPLLNRLLRQEAPERVVMILVGVTIFLCSAVTSICGLHPVMGAFIAGVFLPDEVRIMAARKLDMPTSMLLLPFFFLATGLDAHFSLTDPVIWTIFAAGLFACVVGKVVGTALFARVAGETLPFGITLGCLLQTKGLMELVIVTVFRDAGVVSTQTYSALVIVALVSTALTLPLTTAYRRIAGDSLDVGQPEDETPSEDGVRPPPTPTSPDTIAILRFESDPGDVEISASETVIGRHSGDGVRVPDVRVSRHHAQLVQDPEGGFAIHNQTAVRSEPNEMTVNGEYKEHAELATGDRVTLGGVPFIFYSVEADS